MTEAHLGTQNSAIEHRLILGLKIKQGNNFEDIRTDRWKREGPTRKETIFLLKLPLPYERHHDTVPKHTDVNIKQDTSKNFTSDIADFLM